MTSDELLEWIDENDGIVECAADLAYAMTVLELTERYAQEGCRYTPQQILNEAETGTPAGVPGNERG